MHLPEQFLSSVLPATGWRIFNFILPGPDGNRPASEHAFQPYGMSEAEGLLNWALDKGADLYFGVGSFGGKMRTIVNGRRAGEQVPSRKADNSYLHRCLRIDVDAGAGKAYANQHEALAAIKAFFAGSGMPASWVVDSGYGFHLYWPFTSDIDPVRWQALSQQLAAAVAHHGLVVDSTVTTDAARILRLPGSSNFKHNASKPVRILVEGAPTDVEHLEQLLAGYAPAAPLPGTSALGAVPAGMRGAVNPLAANLHPAYFLRGVLTRCPGMAAMVLNHGAHADEPLWHAALALVNKAADTDVVRERVAMGLSDGHAAFDTGTFYSKWAQVQAQDYEPPTCAKFHQLNMPECHGCPLRTSIKSPCVLGRPEAPKAEETAAVPLQVHAQVAPQLATPVVALTAAPVHTTQQVGVFLLTPGVAAVQIVDGPVTASLSIQQGIPCHLREREQADGSTIKSWTRLGGYQLLEVERLLSWNGSASITAITFSRGTDGMVRIEFAHTELTDGRAFNAMLARNGIHMPSQEVKILQDKFMPEFLSQLQRVRQANAIAGRCGWNDDFTQFVLGTRVFTAAGESHVRPAGAPEEMEAYHEAGDETLWRQAIDLVLSGGADRQAVLALGIAAPLMAFSGVDGVLLNAYSPESGVGKSTLCDAALSLWGAPNTLRKDYRDTPAATFHLAAVSGNMPMVIDEFTNVDGKELSNYVYTITQGRERHRLSADSRLKANTNRWCLPTIATSNNSVHAKLQQFRSDATAEAARVFELRLRPLDTGIVGLGSKKTLLDAMSRNYGFLGAPLVKLYVSRPASYWQDMMTKRINWWDEQMSRGTEDRFRSVVCALIEIGATLGRALGYAFDVAAINTVMMDQWRMQVESFEANRIRPLDFVTNYITDNLNLFAAMGGPNGDQPLGQIGTQFVGELRGKSQGSRLVIDRVQIPLKRLKDYVVECRGDWKVVSDWLLNEKDHALQGLPSVLKAFNQLTFMRGTPRQVRLMGIAFGPEVLGQAAITIAPTSGVVTPLNAGAAIP